MYCITCGEELVIKSKKLHRYHPKTGTPAYTVIYVCPKREKLSWWNRLWHVVGYGGSGESYSVDKEVS